MPPDNDAQAQGAEGDKAQGASKPDDKSGDQAATDKVDADALQKKISDLERDNKKYRDTQRKADADRQAADEAKLSADEKVAKQIADLEAKLSDQQSRGQTRAMKATFLAEGAKSGALYPEDVYRLVNLDEVDFDDDGNPTNATALVDALKKARPQLFGRPGSGGFDGGARRDATKPRDMNDVLRSAAHRS